MEHAEEAAPEAATQRLARLVCHLDATIGEAELCERLLEVFVVVYILRIDASVDDSLSCLITWEGFHLGAINIESVTDLCITNRFHVAQEVTNLALLEHASRFEIWLNNADLVHFVSLL